jgi:hypothetical protein
MFLSNFLIKKISLKGNAFSGVGGGGHGGASVNRTAH